MTGARDQKIKMIPIAQINVLNPRSRNKRLHREIIDNIKTIGLKRPITVSLQPGSSSTQYDLVCGEGRLEAFRMLGENEIPAIVIHATESDCLVMSLVENIARRQHRPIDIMQEIGSLHKRGYLDAEIGQKIGVTANWVSTIITLLERGEERFGRGGRDRSHPDQLRDRYRQSRSCGGSKRPYGCLCSRQDQGQEARRSATVARTTNEA